MKKIIMMAIVLCAVILSPPAFAKHGNKKHDKHYQQQSETLNEAAAVATDRIFTAIERELIAEYFGVRIKGENDRIIWDDNKNYEGRSSGKHKRKGLPPGLAKRKHLPPGLQKQLDKNGCLPPGLEKRDLPSSLLKKLPRPPRGTKRLIVGSDVLLVDAATNYVLDVIEDVIRNK